MGGVTIRRAVPALLIVLALVGCTAEEPSPVQVGEVTRAPVTEVVEAPATVGARATATLRSPAQGTVAKLYVGDGDKVDKGQILARISSPQARDQLRQANEALRLASSAGAPRAAFSAPSLRLNPLDTSALDRKVAREFDKARKAARKVTDPEARRQLLAAIDMAQSQHRANRAALTTITRNLQRSVNGVLSQVTGQINAGIGGITASMSSLQAASRTQAKAAAKTARTTVDGLTIKAPFAGVVTLGRVSAGGADPLAGLLGQLPSGIAGQAGGLGGSGGGPTAGSGPAAAVAVGVPVSAGDPIVTVTDVSKLALAADVDETDVLLVSRGVAAEAEFDAVPGATYRAEVTGVGVTPMTGTTGGVSYPVRLSLGSGAFDHGGKAPRPKPGMSAVVRLTVRESPDALAVPASAIVTSGRDTVVWAVEGGTAERRVVRLGAQGEDTVEVLDGLRLGERIVIRGADGVRQGQEIR
jgi:multidrug efflux pump subunit AcrA (membrane-fusion protein)